MFIVLGDGTTVEKKKKEATPTIYQAQDKYPDPSQHSRSKSKETPAKEEAYYCFGQNGKKNPLPTPEILSAKPEEIRPDAVSSLKQNSDSGSVKLKPGDF